MAFNRIHSTLFCQTDLFYLQAAGNTRSGQASQPVPEVTVNSRQQHARIFFYAGPRQANFKRPPVEERPASLLDLPCIYDIYLPWTLIYEGLKKILGCNAKYAYFCRENHNICPLLLQKSQHTRIQILCIIKEFLNIIEEKKLYITLFCSSRNRYLLYHT